MNFARFFSSKLLFAVLTASLVGFVVLSWWLLFRDERALAGFEFLYPFFNGSLFSIREVLLRYSLNVLPTIIFLIFSLTAFISYVFLLKKEHTTHFVIKWAIIFQLIVFLSYPILSTDIFSYISSNRVQSIHGMNKWMVAPENFTDDVFNIFADWQSKTNVYGYVNHALYSPATFLGKDDVFTSVLLYKVTVGFFALASIFIFSHLLNKKTAKEKSYYLKLIFWNPLFLLEILGSGHNDMFMLVFLLLSIMYWQKKNLILAGLFIAFGVQVKLIYILFFGFFALYLLQKKNVAGFFKYVSTFLIVNGIAFALMDTSPITFLFRVLYNTQSYWQSVPGLFSRFLPQFEFPFSLIFVLAGLVIVFLQVKKNYSPIVSAAFLLFLYLVFFTGAYWNWYVLWVFIVLPFIKDKGLSNTILLFTFTSLLAYPFLWFSFRFGFGSSFWSIFMYLLIFGVPIGFLGYNNCKVTKDKQ